ncbi:hypothetical protein [Streptomyces yaizuensis]|uniref:Uncharacterized protein n=1 Tax=Streptomyces yaizuensis TaxID=2989713 RepID=A0ABQ5P2T5_9ACTN|nr:hypothetical protein SYYSPA8_21460 [Streptomyces sp. YSPA8]
MTVLGTALEMDVAGDSRDRGHPVVLMFGFRTMGGCPTALP